MINWYLGEVMSRSGKKGPYVDSKLMKKVLKQKRYWWQ